MIFPAWRRRNLEWHNNSGLTQLIIINQAPLKFFESSQLLSYWESQSEGFTFDFLAPLKLPLQSSSAWSDQSLHSLFVGNCDFFVDFLGLFGSHISSDDMHGLWLTRLLFLIVFLDELSNTWQTSPEDTARVDLVGTDRFMVEAFLSKELRPGASDGAGLLSSLIFWDFATDPSLLVWFKHFFWILTTVLRFAEGYCWETGTWS